MEKVLGSCDKITYTFCDSFVETLDNDYTYFELKGVLENMETSIDMGEIFMAEMKELKKAIVDGHIKQQVMEDKIFALKSEKVGSGRVGEIEVESKGTFIDATKSNSKQLQEIAYQAIFLLGNLVKGKLTYSVERWQF